MPNEIDEILNEWREVCEAATKGGLQIKEDFNSWAVCDPGGKVIARFLGMSGKANAKLFALSRAALRRAIEALEEMFATVNVRVPGMMPVLQERITRILSGETEKPNDDTT